MNSRLKNPNQNLPDYVKGYINNPNETFNCELKSWLNISNDSDRIKIAKTCLALKNNNGGVILIGISDNGEIEIPESGRDPTAEFSQDEIQGIVSKYSASLFEVEVNHVYLNDPSDAIVVAIVIPSGLTTPIMCKKGSPQDSTTILNKGAIYTRTLGSNGTVSSAIATQHDLEEITKKCHGNRVADIGEFFRRHLTEENIKVMRKAAIINTNSEDQDEFSELEDFSASSVLSYKTETDSNNGG